MADSIEETDVAVVGAGGGEAVLALALAKQVISTVVLDQAGWSTQGLAGGNSPTERATSPRSLGCVAVVAGRCHAIRAKIAAGLLPDLRANEKSPHPMSS